jgi:hypothetical protein
MPTAVRVSAFAFRGLWLINLALGVYTAYFVAGATRGWTIAHVFTGLLVIALLWFLGTAQALVRGGSLLLNLGAFLTGVGVVMIGIIQAFVSGVGLVVFQVLHILLILGAIAVGEICYSRYRKGLVSGA